MEACKMSVPCKLERSFLSHDEYETIRLTRERHGNAERKWSNIHAFWYFNSDVAYRP
jgi:hypothetical protein